MKTVTAAGLITLLVLLLAGCGTPTRPPRLDPEVERNVETARGFYAAGSVEKAVTYYRKALNRALLIDDPGEIGRCAYNLAVCRTAQKQYDEALSLVSDAQAAFQRAGIDSKETELLTIRLLRLKGQTDEASAMAQKARRSMEQRDADCSIELRLLLTELACDKGDVLSAASELGRIDRKKLLASQPGLQAAAAVVKARVLLLDEKAQSAAVCLDEAADNFKKAGCYLEMAQALNRAGQAYESSGAAPVAMDRYYRSARSLFQYKKHAQAAGITAKAVGLAKNLNDAGMLQRLERLDAEISAASKPENK